MLNILGYHTVILNYNFSSFILVVEVVVVEVLLYLYISKCKYVSTRFSVLQVKYQVERKYMSISWLVSAAPQQHILLIPTSRLWLRVLAVCRRKRHDQPQLSPLSSTAAKGFALCFVSNTKERKSH